MESNKGVLVATKGHKMTEKEFKNKYNELVKNGYFFINHRATANSLGFNSLCAKFNLPIINVTKIGENYNNEYCDMYMFYSEDRLSYYDAKKIMDDNFK